ncbi:MAG: LysR family transcriptional regulator [Verrucomicrobia bacterium]|nr:LysR family transcriptional regulator [Verrucomicrobiota bacterium]
MDLRALHYFVIVAEERNITRAAERLNMSQPPLSAQLKGLEDELGVQLFIRGKRHLTITDAGTHLYRRARQILELANQTQQELRSLEGLSGNLNISLVEGRAPYFLARWIAGFRSEFPQVAVHLWNGSGDEVMERLHRGLADLAMVAAPYNAEQLDGIPVGREPWVAMMSIDHPLAKEGGRFLPLKKLAGQPLYVPSRRSRLDSIRAWFGELGQEPNIAGDLSSYIDAVALAEQNAGICIFPMTTYNESDLVVKRIITESARQIEYALVWKRNERLTEIEQEFINFVQDCLEEERRGTQSYRMPESEYLPPEDTKYL